MPEPLSREETLVDLPPKARAVDAAQRALNELPPDTDVLTAATALGAIHALHAIVPVIVERLRQDAAGNQPSQRMDSWDCADLIEREFGKAP